MPLKDPVKKAEYQKEYWKKWYNKNKNEFKKQVAQANKKQRKEINEWIQEYKSHCKCLLCPESESICLDFHHYNGEDKKFTISRHGQYMNNISVILELEKCFCLCSNCHRKVTIGKIKILEE